MKKYGCMSRQELIKIIERQALEIQSMKTALDDVQCLIDNSTGVAGLHYNGEIADWDDLLQGGRFEEWLIDFCSVTEQYL